MRVFNIMLWLPILFWTCQDIPVVSTSQISSQPQSEFEIIVLGTVQDAGSPQIGCQKECCKKLWDYPDHTRKVTSIGIIDRRSKKNFLVEATPDIKTQTRVLQNESDSPNALPDGILLTHAHIGHYIGLLQLGKEAYGANNVNVFAMPKMSTFLTQNGPWDQLVALNNISINPLTQDSITQLTADISIVPLVVPHRDEYSETVGYKIVGPNKTALFIPDIDKWDLWGKDINEEISQVDYAFLDASFYDGDELGGRDMSSIPHPFIVESFEKFDSLSISDKSKVHFIHFNHTNPLLRQDSKEYKLVNAKGYNVAHFRQKLSI